MKKFPYSNEKIMQIFVQLHKRGLAMFLGYLRTGEPAIWMTYESGLAKSPISIATADMLLDEIYSREFDNACRVASPEVLIGEILEPENAILCTARHMFKRTPNRRSTLRRQLLAAAGLPE